MSICSDVYISLEEARERVRSKLTDQQIKLVEAAVKGMTETELCWELNDDDDPIYWYNIDRSIKKKKVINEKK